MADIKTKDVAKGTIKTIDKAANLGDRMRQAYISTKDKAENSTSDNESSPEEFASDRYEQGVETTLHQGLQQTEKAGQKGIKATKEGVQRFRGNRAETTFRQQIHNGTGKTSKTAQQGTKTTAKSIGKKSIKAVGNSSKKTIKQSARSAGNKNIKTVGKSGQTAHKSIKTAQKTSKAAIKTAQKTAKNAKKAAKASAKAAKKSAQAAKAAAKATARSIKAAVRATVVAVKAAIAGIKSLGTVIVAGGWVAVAIILVIILLFGYIAFSVYGIFMAENDTSTGLTLKDAVESVNQEYQNKLIETRNKYIYDTLEMQGSRASWIEVLTIYTVKVNTDPDYPQEVASMDEKKIQLLKDVFWDMHTITTELKAKTVTEVTETKDTYGNIVTTEKQVAKTILYIKVTHKSLNEMNAIYGFNEEQRGYVRDLTAPENKGLWGDVLKGTSDIYGEIVTVALNQEGNIGGKPYWSWYGFDSRVSWCACFVSWCANECGYIDDGIIPKFAGCDTGVKWFKDRSLWADKTSEPSIGAIVFFDWKNDNGQDGSADHTGIVQKVENGKVFVVEGNSSDSVKVNSYDIGYYEILGYGIPNY